MICKEAIVGGNPVEIWRSLPYLEALWIGFGLIWESSDLLCAFLGSDQSNLPLNVCSCVGTL